jgi:hypothetical protein
MDMALCPYRAVFMEAPVFHAVTVGVVEICVTALAPAPVMPPQIMMQSSVAPPTKGNFTPAR